MLQLSAGVDEERINKLAERLFVTSRQLQRLLREDIPVRQLILSSYQSRHNETTDDGKFTQRVFIQSQYGELVCE